MLQIKSFNIKFVKKDVNKDKFFCRVPQEQHMVHASGSQDSPRPD